VFNVSHAPGLYQEPTMSATAEETEITRDELRELLTRADFDERWRELREDPRATREATPDMLQEMREIGYAWYKLGRRDERRAREAR
jgi:hypothetical protein